MTSTTPLLLLLDCILSQDHGQIRAARARVRQIVADASDANSALKAAALSPINYGDNAASFHNLLQEDVDMILTAFPHIASVKSDSDGSLPLHFAASIGNVPVATRILRQVRPYRTEERVEFCRIIY